MDSSAQGGGGGAGVILLGGMGVLGIILVIIAIIVIRNLNKKAQSRKPGTDITDVQTEISGTKAPRTGTPAPRTGTPAPRTGTPAGIPASQTGTPAPRTGTPAPPSGGEESNQLSLTNLAKDIVSNPVLYETIGAALVLELVFKHPKVIKKVAVSSAKAVSKTAAKVISKVAGKSAIRITEGALMKAIPHVAEATAVKAASKAATRLGEQAAVAGSTGPAAPFVEAAEMAFNLFTGYMDSFNLGGFGNMTNMDLLNSMRDTINKMVKEEYEKNGAEWPVIFGPFDTVSDFNVIQTEINDKQKEIYTSKIQEIQDGWKNGTRRRLPTGSTEDDYVNYFDTNIDLDATFTEAEKQICVKKGGVYKKHPNSSNMYCTWDSDASGKCLAPWPLQGGSDETYYEFNKSTKMCEVRPGAMRQKCESLGLDVTYNIDTGSCNLTDKYCRRYGADQGLKNGDCKISQGQEIAETIFGRTFVRSIVNVFDPKNYEPCPPGSSTPHELTALVAVGTGGLAAGAGGALIETMLCRENKCPPDKDNVNGICYDKCPDGFGRKADSFGNKVNGMCYKCPEGYNPSTAGLCHSERCPPGTEAGTGLGIDLCYKPCPPGKSDNGAAFCADNCPAGYDTLVATCQRNPKTVTDPGVVARCPPGWKTTVEGPAGMCEPPCPEGQKKIGALCYDNSVTDLSYVPSYSCPDGGTNTGLLCTRVLHCDGGWDEHQIGICSIKCSHYRTWNAFKGCSGGDTYPARKEGCRPGYHDVLGVCWGNEHGGPGVPKSLLDVGSCDADRDRVGGMCYKRCNDASWGAGPGYVRSAAGSCLLPAHTIDRHPVIRPNPIPKLSDKPAQSVGPQKPKGTSYHVFPRKRATPFPSTSESDFKNSTLGKHVQAGINAARNGDVRGLGEAMAATAIVGNPQVVGLGAQDLADIGVSELS